MPKTTSNKYDQFRAFYDATHGKVIRFAFKHSSDASLGEEAVQSAYLKLWEKWTEISPDYLSKKAYLHVTIRNLIIKEYRRKLVEQEMIYQYQSLQTQENDEHRSIPENLVQTIRQVVATLPNRQQQVFKLVKEDGLTYKEAAETLSISESTVEKHIIRALKTLRSRLSDLAYTIIL